MLRKYIKRKFIWLNQGYQIIDQLFLECADELYQSGYVEENFYQEILKREQQYPTCLELDGYAVAIPHVYPSLIRKNFIFLITLKEPIKMYTMNLVSKQVNCRILFILGFKNSQQHLMILKEMIALIQNKKLIQKFLLTNHRKDILYLIKQFNDEKLNLDQRRPNERRR